MPPVKLLVVSTRFGQGGAERFASTLLNGVDRARFQPSVCILRPVIGYPLAEDVPRSVLNHRGGLDLPRVVLALAKEVRRIQPDVVLSTIFANSAVTAAALQIARTRVQWIARIGSNPETGSQLRRQTARLIYRDNLAQCVVNSEGLRSSVRRCFPALGSKTLAIANPTDFAFLDRRALELSSVERAQGPLLIAAGRLCVEKGYDVMLRTLARVRLSIPAQLWICGDGPDRARLVGLTHELGLTDQVRFLGDVENPWALMRQADLFLMTSRTEGLPNALIEAHGLGLRAVSTRCEWGPEEIIDHNQTGILAAVDDVEGLSSGVLRLLGDVSGRARMETLARERTRLRFDHARLIGKWEELIGQVANRKKS